MVFSYSAPNNCALKFSFFVTCRGVTECHDRLSGTKNNSIEYKSGEFTEEYLIELLRKNPTEIIVWYNRDIQSIHISRNVFGTVPIYYSYMPGKSFVFSTQITDLLLSDGLTSGIDARKVLSYFSIANLSAPYSPNTIFSQISAIPPGHYIKFVDNRVEVVSYVEFISKTFDKNTKLSEYGNAFRLLFLKSVDKHLHGAKTIGMHLSGGMDSSSVSVASQHVSPTTIKHTFFYDIESSTSGEKAFSKDVSQKIGSYHHSVVPKYQFIDDLYSFTQFNGQPIAFLGATGMWHQSVEKAVHQNCDVFLTGHGGDTIVGYGQDHFANLFKARDWQKLASAINEYCETAFRETSAATPHERSVSEHQNILLKKEFLTGLKAAIQKRSPSEFSQLLFVANKIFNLPAHDFILSILKGVWKTQIGKLQAPQSILKDSFLRTSELPNQALFSFANTLHGKNLKYHNEILFNQNVNVNEDYYSLGAFLGINIQHPFFDKDLYELCLAVPDELRFNNGYTRGTLREGLKDLLPPSVAKRRNKANFESYFTASILVLHKESQDLLVDGAPIWEYVDKQKFNTYIRFLQSDRYPHPLTQVKVTFAVLRTLNMAVWLDIYKNNSFSVPEYRHKVIL